MHLPLPRSAETPATRPEPPAATGAHGAETPHPPPRPDRTGRASDPTPNPPGDLVSRLSRLPLRTPQNRRQLLELLAIHPPAQDLSKLFDRLDLAGATASMIDQLVHGRVPDASAQPVDGPVVADGYDPRAHLLAAMRSSEFQTGILWTLLRSFPEKRRDIFIHIPKCAGTDLVATLAERRLSIPAVLAEEAWTSKDDLLHALIEIMKILPFYDDFFVSGHIELARFVDAVAVRPIDRFFTIVRDPVDLMVSQANYAVSRLCRDPERRSPDTRQILAHLDLQRLPDSPSNAFLKELAARCLVHPDIARPNLICHYLSDQPARNCDNALRGLVMYDFEVTTTDGYNQWLKDKWGISSTTRHNSSTAFLQRHEIRHLFDDTLADRIAEDRKLFDVVSWALARTGASSVSGTEIARLASQDLAGFSQTIARERSAAGPPHTAASGQKLLVAQGAKAVERYLVPLPHDVVPEQHRLAEVLGVNFAAEGNSRGFVRAGWARAERNFTWTAAKQVQLRLPRPATPAPHLLRILAAPFVAPGHLPAQRVGLIVNEQTLGHAVIRDLAVLECEVPWQVLQLRDEIKVVLDLPDAAKASTVKETQDARILGLAVRTLSLLRAGAPGAATDDIGVPDDTELVKQFESLGENCEFGLVQRRCGAEPLGLLRFSSTPLAPLLRGLRARFADLGSPESVEIEVSRNGREYMVVERRFGFRYHAWAAVGEQAPDEIQRRECLRLPLLARKLTEDLIEGRKIFVYHGMAPIGEAEARELAGAVRDYGPGTLLWVELADAANPPGSVTRIAPGLLKGHMDRFAPGEHAHDLSLDCWLVICRNAYTMLNARTAT
jgi:hypothetical protein